MLERIAAPNEHLHLEAEQCIELKAARESSFFCTLLSGVHPAFHGSGRLIHSDWTKVNGLK